MNSETKCRINEAALTAAEALFDKFDGADGWGETVDALNEWGVDTSDIESLEDEEFAVMQLRSKYFLLLEEIAMYAAQCLVDNARAIIAGKRNEE